MCIAIVSPQGVALPSKDKLLLSFCNNPDGAGFCYASHGTVYVYKGFFDFDSFYERLMTCDKRYNLTKNGVLLHFRISTHGSINRANCHPFPVTANERKLTSSFSRCRYAVVHNGICSVTASTSGKSKLSDTALFVRDYLSRIAAYDGWFTNDTTIPLIEELIDSKMAVLSHNGEIKMTSGFHRESDGNYYSNYSYMEPYYGLYRYGFPEDWYSAGYGYDDVGEFSLMELKRGESIYYDDGTVEEYSEEYHSTFRTFVTETGEVYALIDHCEGNLIPMDSLSYIGSGAIVDHFSAAAATELAPMSFRADAEVVG